MKYVRPITHEELLNLIESHKLEIPKYKQNMITVKEELVPLISQFVTKFNKDQAEDSTTIVNSCVLDIRFILDEENRPAFTITNGGTSYEIYGILRKFLLNKVPRIYPKLIPTISNHRFLVSYSHAEKSTKVRTEQFLKFGMESNGDLFIMPDIDSGSYYYYKPYHYINIDEHGTILKVTSKINHVVISSTEIDKALKEYEVTDMTQSSVSKKNIIKDYVDLCGRLGIDYKDPTPEDIIALGVMYMNQNKEPY